MADNLWFKGIGEDLNVLVSTKEPLSHYYQRVVFSACSAWMLTSLYNGDGRVSIEHIKASAKQRLEAFRTAQPLLAVVEANDVVDYLYYYHLENGSFYHAPLWLRPANRKLIGNESISLVRGMRPEEDVCFSGMAPYSQGCGEASLTEGFDLTETAPEDILRMLWRRGTKQHFIDDGSYEYLNVNREPMQDYFTRKVPDGTQMQYLRRIREGAGYDHFLVKEDMICRLDDNVLSAGFHEYARLALMNIRHRQKIVAGLDAQLVWLEIGFRLPSPELRFLRYVAWPDDLTTLKGDVWRFSVTAAIWSMLRERFSFLGYEMEEHTYA